MIVIIIIVHINEKDLNFYVDFYYIFCYKCIFKYVDCLFENYDNQIEYARFIQFSLLYEYA
jgi:hypothetical protein